MGGIPDEQVEWAVVNRLKGMLDAPPKTKFNVTQSFALFGAILLWTKNRAWVPETADGDADHAVRGVRISLGTGSIFETPWLLSTAPPRSAFPKFESYQAALSSL